MTAAKRGDRVRVSYEATYFASNGHPGHIVILDLDACTEYRAGVPASATIEVLTPPVKAGDVIPQYKVVDLPVGAVVVGTGNRERHFKTAGGWVRERSGALNIGDTVGSYRVEYLPGAAA